jgi:HSP20 family molecular chaperone IbpA
MRDTTIWMWGETLRLLERADRLHRQFFQPGPCQGESPTWEPPVDIFETAQQLLIMAALPGVASEQLEIVIEGATLTIRGQRSMPDAFRDAQVRRLEIPFGRFERNIELPAVGYQVDELVFRDGCLALAMSVTA